MKLNIYNLISLLLPIHKRKPNRIGILNMLLSPLVTLINEFYSYRSNTLYVSGITSQTLSLEAYLNYKLDSYNKRIKIRHFQKPTTLVLYNEGESPTNTFVGNEREEAGIKVVVKFQSEFNVLTIKDFEVLYPSTINESLLKSEVLKYKLAGKTYNLIPT